MSWRTAMNRKASFASLLVTGILALFVPVSAARSGADTGQGRESIEGSWKVTVFFTFPEGMPPVHALYTFTRGGGFVMTANNDPRIVGPGHGVWIRKGDGEFGLTLTRMRFDPTTNPPTYLGTLTSRSAPLRLNEAGDGWTSDRWVIDFYDPD